MTVEWLSQTNYNHTWMVENLNETVIRKTKFRELKFFELFGILLELPKVCRLSKWTSKHWNGNLIWEQIVKLKRNKMWGRNTLYWHSRSSKCERGTKKEKEESFKINYFHHLPIPPLINFYWILHSKIDKCRESFQRNVATSGYSFVVRNSLIDISRKSPS